MLSCHGPPGSLPISILLQSLHNHLTISTTIAIFQHKCVLSCDFASTTTYSFLPRTITMKLSALLLIANQAIIALSAHLARPSADDERGTINATDLAPVDLVERACYFGSKYEGCDGGYCWRTCGPSGQWCWLASQNGNGPWLTCSTDSQCASGITTRGSDCGKGGCDACGCSC